MLLVLSFHRDFQKVTNKSPTAISISNDINDNYNSSIVNTEPMLMYF